MPLTARAAIAAALAIAFAGCGGDSTSTGASTGDPAPTYTEAQVMDAAGLTPTDGGIAYKTASGCEVAVVLNTPQEVELYADAGDTVVTNPSETAGVKVSGKLNPATSMLEEGPCIPELERALADLD